MSLSLLVSAVFVQDKKGVGGGVFPMVLSGLGAAAHNVY